MFSSTYLVRNSVDDFNFNEDDFPKEYFPSEWSVVYDRLGYGCQVDFPIEMKPALTWSGLCYNKTANGTSPRPRYFTETIKMVLF